jgi:SAM-dependent methyltransferase
MSVFEKVETFEAWQEDYYQPLSRWYYDRAIPRMVQGLNPKPDSVVLDAGCGPGGHSIRTAKAGYRAQAVDISHTVVKLAQDRAEKAGVADRIAFEQGDLTNLRFEDNSFDCVFSWGCIIHIPDIEKALAELARIVKPGGRLALQVLNRGAWDGFIERTARKLLGKKPLESSEQPLGTGYWYDFQGGKLYNIYLDIPKLIQHVEGLGFTCVHRRAAEFTEIQRRVKGFPRTCLLFLNNVWFVLRLPAGPACTNVITFEKRK